MTEFQLDSSFRDTAVFVGLLLYTTLARATAGGRAAPFPGLDPLFVPGWLLLSVLPSKAIPFCWWTVAAAHSLETLYLLYLCGKHRTPFVVGVSASFLTGRDGMLNGFVFVCAAAVHRDLHHSGLPCYWAVEAEGPGGAY